MYSEKSLSVFTEIFKLKDILEKHHIQHSFSLIDGDYPPIARFQIVIYINEDKSISVIEGHSSMGNALINNVVELAFIDYTLEDQDIFPIQIVGIFKAKAAYKQIKKLLKRKKVDPSKCL